MEVILQILEALKELIVVSYLFAIVAVSWLIFTYLLINPKKGVQILVTIGVGLLLMVLWYYKINNDFEKLLSTFFMANVFYSWIVKSGLKYFKMTYNNNKGLV